MLAQGALLLRPQAANSLHLVCVARLSAQCCSRSDTSSEDQSPRGKAAGASFLVRGGRSQPRIGCGKSSPQAHHHNFCHQHSPFWCSAFIVFHPKEVQVTLGRRSIRGVDSLGYCCPVVNKNFVLCAVISIAADRQGHSKSSLSLT